MVDSEVLQVYMKPPAHEESKAPSKGFVVRDAPWTANSSEKVRLCSSWVPSLCQEVGMPVTLARQWVGQGQRVGSFWSCLSETCLVKLCLLCPHRLQI